MERTKTHYANYASNLIETILDPLITINTEGKIMDINQATVNITGIERDKLFGSNYSEYFTEPQMANNVYKKIFEKGFITDFPLTFRHKTGKLTDVLFNGSVYKNNSGNVLGAVVTARDISEQKWAVDLRNANKELAIQNKEKVKRAAELIVADKELIFQNSEKDKRAARVNHCQQRTYFSERRERKTIRRK